MCTIGVLIFMTLYFHKSTRIPCSKNFVGSLFVVYHRTQKYVPAYSMLTSHEYSENLCHAKNKYVHLWYSSIWGLQFAVSADQCQFDHD